MRTHEGGIDVQSVPGQGSRFTLYFPVATAQAAPSSAAVAALPAAPAQARSRAHCHPPKPHVMYVDDDQALVFLVQRLLRRRVTT